MKNQLSSRGKKIQEDLGARRINPEQFEGRILFMSMFYDIDWTQNGNSFCCISNSKNEQITQNDFSEDIRHSSVLKMKKNVMERTLTNQKKYGTMKPIR